jgi:hypothetical protein
MIQMDAQKQNSALIRGHIHVARMAYKAGEYHAAFRNLNSALYEHHEAQGHPIDNLDLHELRRLLGKVQVALRICVGLRAAPAIPRKSCNRLSIFLSP